MSMLKPHEEAAARERDALLARPDALRVTLQAGARVEIGATSLTCVSAESEKFAWGMCGSCVAVRVVLKVAQGPCKPIRVEVGPKPIVVKAAGLSMTVNDGSTPESVTLTVA
jgi:hypothetical protein